MDRPMMDIAAELLSLSPLLESSREKDTKRVTDQLARFQELTTLVHSSLVEPVTVSGSASGTTSGTSALPSAFLAKSSRTSGPTRTLGTPAPQRAANPLHEALRARAAQRLASFSSSRILRPKPTS